MQNWQDHLRVEELADAPAAAAAGDLYWKSFAYEIPKYPRHFVLRYFPEPNEAANRVVAYVHQLPWKDVYLGGGMCVDETVYRSFPKWLFAEIRREGGLATIVTRGSLSMLGDCAAAFGYVGEPRARQADLRTGYVDTGHPHLMVFWRKEVSPEERKRLIDLAASFGPF